MPSSLSPGVHPREIELAMRLKDCEIDWNVETGDWFIFDGVRHVVMRKVIREATTLLYGQDNRCFDQNDVTWIPHITFCQEWLQGQGWKITLNEEIDAVKGTAQRRHSDYRIEKTEPTDKGTVYSLMLEVLDLQHFGWA